MACREGEPWDGSWLGNKCGCCRDGHGPRYTRVEGGGAWCLIVAYQTATFQSSDMSVDSSGNASKAKSNSLTSQTFRPSINLAGPTRPSFRNSSNLLGEIP